MNEKKPVPMPRTFAGPAYLREVERGTFMLFRNIEVEVVGRDGRPEREKLREVCVSPFPLREFDPREDDERQVVMHTVHPQTQAVLRLVEVR